jgi:hypothetical protein
MVVGGGEEEEELSLMERLARKAAVSAHGGNCSAMIDEDGAKPAKPAAKPVAKPTARAKAARPVVLSDGDDEALEVDGPFAPKQKPPAGKEKPSAPPPAASRAPRRAAAAAAIQKYAAASEDESEEEDEDGTDVDSEDSYGGE